MMMERERERKLVELAEFSRASIHLMMVYSTNLKTGITAHWKIDDFIPNGCMDFRLVREHEMMQ